MALSIGLFGVLLGLPLPPVQVVVQDVVGIGPAFLQMALQETERELQPSGVSFEWRIERPAELPENVNVKVVLLASPPRCSAQGQRVLGTTDPRQSPPASLIYVERVLALMGDATLPANIGARALGRVIAHELVHALAPERGHAGAGLMTRALTPQALAGGPLALDLTSRAALRAWRRQPAPGCSIATIARVPGTPAAGRCTSG